MESQKFKQNKLLSQIQYWKKPPKPTNHNELTKQGITLAVNEISNHKQYGVIGGHLTYLAIKNPQNFMIGTHTRGLKVIKNNLEIYSKKFSEGESDLLDMIYVDHLDSYLIYLNQRLYIKEINAKPAFVILDIGLSSKLGAFLRYSKINRRVVAFNQRENLSVINLERKQVEIEARIRRERQSKKLDFRITGRKEEAVVSIAHDGSIELYTLNYDLRKVCTAHRQQIELIRERREQGVSIAVSDRGELVLARVGSDTYTSSRSILFEVKGNFLVKKAVIDEFYENSCQKWALEFCGLVGRFTLWAGLSLDNGHTGVIHIYCWDREKQELRELKQSRVNSKDSRSLRLTRLGNRLYFTGWYGSVQEMCLHNNNS